VVTTGGSTLAAIEALQAEGRTIVGVVSVLDRLAGGGARIEQAAGAPYRPLGHHRRSSHPDRTGRG
jgi:orotate phosphoribosyltransferase